MKFNLDTIREDTRRLGLILVAAGIINPIFQDKDPLISLSVIIVGILMLLIGNAEDKQLIPPY